MRVWTYSVAFSVESNSKNQRKIYIFLEFLVSDLLGIYSPVVCLLSLQIVRRIETSVAGRMEWPRCHVSFTGLDVGPSSLIKPSEHSMKSHV